MLALLIYFLVCGFLISYLWTRTYLAGAFAEADLASIGGKLSRVERKVSDLEKQVEIDARALSIVQRQLDNSGPNATPIPQEEIDAAIQPASPNVKTQIFYQVQTIRSENWRDWQTKPKMERTIPIFRALVASDFDNIFHANHGQLGFALKDQRQSNWVEAEHELSKAIELRGPWQKQGWLFYEFNRAICRVKLDDAFNQEKVTDEHTKQNIMADLRAVAAEPELLNSLLNDSIISKWMELNSVTRSEISQPVQ